MGTRPCFRETVVVTQTVRNQFLSTCHSHAWLFARNAGVGLEHHFRLLCQHFLVVHGLGVGPQLLCIAPVVCRHPVLDLCLGLNDSRALKLGNFGHLVPGIWVGGWVAWGGLRL